ncbi:MAG: glycoside hydrolase family 5 protein [Verrucomicrobiota bacterium]
MTRVLALLLLAVCCRAGDVFEQARRLGRGVNMGNSLEAPKGATWGRAFGPEDFDRIRAAGFDSVRIPVRWADHAGKEAPFAIEAGFMEKVDGLVRVALERKLAVVLNVHHYEALDADPAGQRPRFVALWKQIGERFRDAPDELHFELSNEPHGAHTAELWNANLTAALAEVRRLHPTRAVHVGGVQWNRAATLKDLRLPADDRHLIGHFHCYDPFAFTHQGASWTKGSDKFIGTRWTGTDAEKEALRRTFGLATAWSKAEGRPVFLGEFGAYGKHASTEDRARWTAFMAGTARELGIPFAYWEYQAGFGIWDPAARRWRQELLAALMR